ncbi:MAG: hypothetical protein OEV62_03310 [Actinomycetota bacterium]|nr:hypothetical protein [Actinomycetota bacterium]MDH4352287.1 hypothetical protein [Gemmatimonadota bacterium]
MTTITTLTLTAAAHAEPASHQLADSVAINQAQAAVARTQTWACQQRLHRPRHRTERLERRTRSLATIRWVTRLWQKRLRACERDEQRRSLPVTGDWRTAVRIVQRPYPGTETWLLSCSASEGGHGPWIPNRQGSGANGWLQFMESTFWRMYGAAHQDVTARGYLIPPSAASWYSPLGQALAGAWGVSNGRRHEWFGKGC